MTLHKKKTYKAIKVYLSEAEVGILKKQALRNGLSVTDYLRRLTQERVGKE